MLVFSSPVLLAVRMRPAQADEKGEVVQVDAARLQHAESLRKREELEHHRCQPRCGSLL